MFELVVKRVPVGQLADHLQRALVNFELYGQGIGGMIASTLLLPLSFLYQGGHSSAARQTVQMSSFTTMRVRASRVLSERYHHRERPNYFADVILWGLIIILAVWPMLSLVAALERLR